MLLFSPVPMVRGFGALLVVGIVIALVCAFCAGHAALARFGGVRRPHGSGRAPKRFSAWSGRALDGVLRRPRRVLAAGLIVAVVGLALDTQSGVVSDIRQLVPADLPALRNLDALERESGLSDEINVAVRASDVTTPAMVAWMSRFQDGVLRAHGYRPGKRCATTERPPELCPVLSLPELGRATGLDTGVRDLLAAIPPELARGVVTADRRTANLAFGIRLMPLERQQEIIDDITRRLRPPAGAEASVVGLPVLAARPTAHSPPPPAAA